MRRGGGTEKFDANFKLQTHTANSGEERIEVSNGD